MMRRAGHSPALNAMTIYVEVGEYERREIRVMPATTSALELNDLNRQFEALYLMLG